MSAPVSSEGALKTYRKGLEVLVERLTGGVKQLATEALRPVGPEGTTAEPPAHDPTGTGTEADEEIARGVLQSEEQILAEARAALARCDAGTFGTCERCGRAIARTRLAAIPYARNCIRCAREAETDTNA
ncbi:MAG TPA: TraR/DksA C4-type zinc finger protein [Gemmata sp.]